MILSHIDLILFRFLWLVSLYIIGAAEVLPYVERDLKIIASRVMEKSKELCAAKSVITIHYPFIMNNIWNSG